MPVVRSNRASTHHPEIALSSTIKAIKSFFRLDPEEWVEIADIDLYNRRIDNYGNRLYDGVWRHPKRLIRLVSTMHPEYREAIEFALRRGREFDHNTRIVIDPDLQERLMAQYLYTFAEAEPLAMRQRTSLRVAFSVPDAVEYTLRFKGAW